MGEHVELLVPVKAGAGLNLCKILLWILTVVLALAGFLGILGTIPIILAICTGVGAYFIGLRADKEYEYTLTDKEMDIDVVFSKSSRKSVTTLDLTKLEIMARMGSHRLDGYANRPLKTEDYSSRDPGRDGQKFVLIYDGSRKIVIEPDDRLYKAIYGTAPSKVFND